MASYLAVGAAKRMAFVSQTVVRMQMSWFRGLRCMFAFVLVGFYGHGASAEGADHRAHRAGPPGASTSFVAR